MRLTTILPRSLDEAAGVVCNYASVTWHALHSLAQGMHSLNNRLAVHARDGHMPTLESRLGLCVACTLVVIECLTL